VKKKKKLDADLDADDGMIPPQRSSNANSNGKASRQKRGRRKSDRESGMHERKNKRVGW